MKTAAEIEAELSRAADNLRQLQKAAKDQAARQTPEPIEPPRGLPGIVLPTRLPNPQPR